MSAALTAMIGGKKPRRRSAPSPLLIPPARETPPRLTHQLAGIRISRRIAATLAALLIVSASLNLAFLAWGLAGRLQEVPYVADGSSEGCSPRQVDAPGRAP